MLILSRQGQLSSLLLDQPLLRVRDQLVSKAKWQEETASSPVADSVIEVASVEAVADSVTEEDSVEETEVVSVVASVEAIEVDSAVAVVASEVSETNRYMYMKKWHRRPFFNQH